MTRIAQRRIAGILTTERTAGQLGAIPVVALHGWGVSGELMQPVLERLSPLGYRLYVPDLPGFGGTAAPPTAWSVYDYANWIIEYLDAHRLETVHLIGHSFGGRISLVLGAQHTHRIGKIALSNSAGVVSKQPPHIILRQRTYKLVRSGLEAIGAHATAHRLREWYAARYGSSDYRTAQGVMRETFVRVVTQDLLPVAAQVAKPTLLFWGEKDADTPLWQAHKLEKTLPDAGLIVFPSAGHYTYLEHLDDFIRIVDHFFKQS
ncbi:MAG: alpha/beta hydrolase [Aggregatilineales bacterium]